MKDQRDSHLRKLSTLFDSQFEGPFGLRFGLDGLLGLVPVIGDFITTALSAYIILQASALGCPPAILSRMCFNVLAENVVDMVPFLGNLFDFVWKANNKNVDLLQRHMANPRAVTWKSRLFLAFLLALIFASLVLSAYLGFRVLSLGLEWIQSK